MEVPPAVVVDAHDVCANLDQAQTALHDALGGSVAPEQGWRLRVFDERRGTHIIVTANLDDAQGNAVAHRVIDATASDRCDGVISALGIWAALVLDAEVSKAKAHPRPAKPAIPTTVTGDTPLNTPSVLDPTGIVNADAGVPPPHKRTIEIGSSAVLQNSPDTSTDAALVGGDVFVLIEVMRSLFLRPTVMGASSLGSSGVYVAPRMDVCLRVPGNYVEHRGLLLETCAGTEFVVFDHTDAKTTLHATDVLFALGPTIGLRGDLASDLSVEVRGLANFNVAHSGDDIALLSVRAELGLTWRIR